MALYEAKFRGKGIALHHNDLQLGHGSRVSALTPLQSRFAAQ
jgi:hypothetical protein